MKKIKFCTKNVVIISTLILSVAILVLNSIIFLKLNFYTNKILDAYAYADMYEYNEGGNPELKDVYFNLRNEAKLTDKYYSGLKNKLYNSSNPYVSFFAKNGLANGLVILLSATYIFIIIFANKDLFKKKKRKKFN